MLKKILVLGGSFLQIPLIKYAKSRGLCVITCDYLSENPGHKISDEYYNVSTTDKLGVLSLAKKVKIDAIIAYASDPAVPTAAYVSKEMGLPSSSYEAVSILANKDLFRNTLLQNDYNTPTFKTFTDYNNARKYFSTVKLPVMVKPVDSSGSKGISKVDEKKEFHKAFDYAMEYTRCNQIIIEQYIEKKYPQIHGDGFVYDNELVFTCLGDHYFGNDDKVFTPISTMIPSQCDPEYIRRGLKDINRLMKTLKYGTGPINIEIMVGNDEKVYIMEIGPRNGGNFIPQLAQFATGANMVSWALESAMGSVKYSKDYFNKFCIRGYHSHYILHSNVDGVLKKIEIDKFIRDRILMKQIYKKKCDRISSFSGSNTTIGVLILKYNSLQEMHSTVEEMRNHIKIILES